MPSIERIVPILRHQGQPVPNLVQLASWIDSCLLVAGVAFSYALPVDAAGHKAQVLRITGNGGPIYVSFQGAAVVPVANTVNGTSSGMLRTDLAPQLLFVPTMTIPVSFISSANVLLTIEGWS